MLSQVYFNLFVSLIVSFLSNRFCTSQGNRHIKGVKYKKGPRGPNLTYLKSINKATEEDGSYEFEV